MNKLFRILAPTSALSVVMHIVLWLSMIWLAHIGFAYMTFDSLDYLLLYCGAYAIFVGGPFVVFVTFITRYQICFQKHPLFALAQRRSH